MWNKKAIIAVGLAAVIGVTGVGIYLGTRNSEEEVVTKETTVEYGTLTVGVTESGSVTLGTVEQSFSVDLSENSSSSSGSASSSSSAKSSSSSSGMQGMSMNGAGGGENGSSQSSSGSSGDTGILEVEEIYVSEGQVVEKGDNLLKLTSESIKEARELLTQEVNSAQLTLKKARIDRDSTKVSAKYEYQKNITVGQNAKSEYNNTLSSLQKAVDEAQDAIDEAKTRMAAIPTEIKKLKAQKTTVSNTVSTKNANTTTGKDSGSGMTGAPQNGGTGSGGSQSTGSGSTGSQSTGSSSSSNSSTSSGSTDNTSQIESQISALESELSSLKSNYSTLVNRLAQAKSDQISGKITAKEEYDQAMLNYENAKEIYDIAMDGIDDDVNDAKEALKEAKANLAEFESFVLDGTITTEYAGTILTVGYEKGDTLSTDTAIATYADAEAVNVTVSVSQEDISEIEVGDTVNIVFTAYEEETYHGTVTGFTTSESSSSSSTVSYDVTVNVTGDVSKIYEDMTANVTFVTKELEDVLYVSNKAIQTEGTKSYVKRVSDGNTEKVEVETGFSNGTSVEIKTGLSKGDTVLIESRVSGS